MYRNLYIGICIMAAALLSSCGKNIDVFIPDAGQTGGLDSSWATTITPTMPVSLLRKELATVQPLTDSVDNNILCTVNSPLGIQVTFPAHSLGVNAGTTTGKVALDLMVLRKKGDLIRMNRPTISNGILLNNVETFYIHPHLGSAPVALAPTASYYVRIVETLTAPAQKLFLGDTSVPSAFNWLYITDLQHNIVNNGLGAYEIYTNNLHWLSCGFPVDTNITSPKVNLSLSLPVTCTNKNTEVFLVFRDLHAVAPLNGDPAQKKFISDKMPVGKTATLVAISKQGNDYFFDYTNLVTGTGVTNGAPHTVNLNPRKTGLTLINAFLDTL